MNMFRWRSGCIRVVSRWRCGLSSTEVPLAWLREAAEIEAFGRATDHGVGYSRWHPSDGIAPRRGRPPSIQESEAGVLPGHDHSVQAVVLRAQGLALVEYPASVSKRLTIGRCVTIMKGNLSCQATAQGPSDSASESLPWSED